MEQKSLAVVDSNRFVVKATESAKRNGTSMRPLSRKAFFANTELSTEFKGNYFNYMKANESLGAMASEEARAAGLVFAGYNRSTDKVTGELLGASVRWAKAPKAKQDDEIAKLRAEIEALTNKLAARK